MKERELGVQKNLRVLSLFVKLEGGGIINKKYEANHFHVTERTIERDISDIRIFLADETVNGREDRIVIYNKEREGYMLSKVIVEFFDERRR